MYITGGVNIYLFVCVSLLACVSCVFVCAGFSLLWGWEGSPHWLAENLLVFLKREKFSTSTFSPTVVHVITNKNFIFSFSHYSCTIFVLTSNSLCTQVILILILIDVQYLQNVFFFFDKGSKGQNHAFQESHLPIRNHPSKYSHSSPTRGNFPLHLNVIWKTLVYCIK